MASQFAPSEGDHSSKGTQSNHRATVRYQCPPATTSRVMMGDDKEFQRAWLQDLSSRGAGLILTRPVPALTLLVIVIKTGTPAKVYELAAHVAHSTPKSDGTWLVGCELLQPLSDDDLDLLLYPSS